MSERLLTSSRGLSLIPSSWVSCSCLVPIMLFGCASDDDLFPELEPEAFVSPAASEAWEPVPREGYEPAHVAPVVGVRDQPSRFDGPCSLMQLVDLALETNPQTRVAWEQARASAARFGSIRGAWYPTFGLAADLDYQRELFPGGDNVVLDFRELSITPGVEVSYVLLDFGRRSSQDAGARASLWAANLEFNRSIQQTVYDVQVAYFGLDNAIGLYEASLRELELAITVVDAVEDSLAVGLATAPELLLARQELAKAEFDVQSRVAGIDDARSALLVAIGLPANQPLEIQSLRELPLPADLAVKVDDAINLAMENRPDLAAAVAEVRAAEADVRLAEADFYPTVTFDGSAGWQQFTANTSVNRGALVSQQYGAPVWNIGLNGQWILFEGYSLRNNLREARALRRKAQAELETLRIKAIGEVWDSYNDYLAAQRQYDFGLALVESSREAYEAMLATYEVGLATITQLIDAEKDLAESLSTLVETRSFLLTSSARVSLAIGSGRGRAPRDRVTNASSDDEQDVLEP
ncbi:MAG: TolC family protein [Phycisphaerales bacterium]|nr:TolC family protein [Phycisphaerales bacterium]